MAKLIKHWVTSCEQCIRESRVDNRLTRPALQNPSEHNTAPEDAMQINLVPELPPSGCYENIVRAMDLFLKNSFAYPTSCQDAKSIAKSIITIMIKHAYLPTTIISDKGSVFMSQVIKEVGDVLGITAEDYCMRRQLECLNEHMFHSRKPSIFKQVKKIHVA